MATDNERGGSIFGFDRLQQTASIFAYDGLIEHDPLLAGE